MLRQLQHIAVTYASRKLFWLFAALYLFFTWAEMQFPSRETPLLWHESQVRWQPRREFDGLTAFLDWQATDEELRELRGLTIRGQYTVPLTPALAPGSDGKPALELKLDSDVTSEHLAKLVKCVRLTELHWLAVELTPDVGQALGKLPNLQHLELTLIGNPIPSLEALPPLTNLRFFQVPQVPPVELGLLAKHPQLTTVEIQDSLPHRPLPGELNTQRYAIWQKPSTLSEANQIERVMIRTVTEHTKAIMEGARFDEVPREKWDSAVPISADLASSVAELPKLKAVEIRNPQGGWPAKSIDDEGLRQALADRPDVVVNPVVLDFDSLLSPFSAFSATIVLVVVGLQLFSQFSGSWSRTVPAFAAPHWIAAGMFLAAHIFIACAILMARRPVAFLPALAMATALPAFGGSFFALLARRPQWFPVLLPLAFSGVAILPIIGTHLLRSLPEGFVGGERPEVAVALLLAECIAFLVAGRSLKAWAPRLHEAGIPSGLNLFQTIKQLQMQRLGQNQRIQPGITLSLNWFDSALESFLSSSSFVDRKRQWRAAEPSNGRIVLLSSVIGPWLIVGVFALTMRLLGGQSTDPESYIFYSVFLGTYSLSYSTLILTAGSQTRRSILGQELLRPMRRREMEDHLRTSLWIDLWPAMLTTVAYLILLWMIHSWGPAAWQSQTWNSAYFGQVLLSLTLPIPIWAGMLLLITIPREFWRGLLIAAGYIFLFGIVQSLVLWTTIPKTTEAHVAIRMASYWLSGGSLVLGMAMAWWATRRLHRVEWGIDR